MIRILVYEYRDALEDQLGRKPTQKEVRDFKTYIYNDIYQWLNDNAKSFIREKL